MNVSKPRPNDHPLLVLYIVGGITCSEVHQIRETLAAYHPNTQVSDHVTIATENCSDFTLVFAVRVDRVCVNSKSVGGD